MPTKTEEAAELNSQAVREICGELLDWKLAAILSLRPTAAELATAVGWASGVDELGAEGHPLTGRAAQVYEVLTSDEIYGEER